MTIQEYVQRLLAHTGVTEVKIDTIENEDEILITIAALEDEMGIIIGYHGETLAALQRIVRIVFKDEVTKRIVVDINNYRQERVAKLQEMTKQIASRVLETGDSYTFAYLPANERFIVHSTLSEEKAFSGLESVSEGEGFDRRLIIKKKQ